MPCKLPEDGLIRAHMDWKLRLQSIIAGTEETPDIDAAESDRLCLLGQWLHGHGECATECAEYNELKTLHAEFHHHVGKLLRHADAGRRDLVLSDIRSGHYALLSARLIDLITRLQERLNTRTPPTPEVPAA